jgi:predicted PhzF superfamily epimerase YddE/YHI9
LSIKLFHVDAFADKKFAGNPAAVCLLPKPAHEAWMQSMASEMNLSETAFLNPEEPGFRLRWFTPKVEVSLCGHATLASAHVLWEEGVVPPSDKIKFCTKSGELLAWRHRGFIELDFPARPAVVSRPPAALLEALGVVPKFAGRNQDDYLFEIDGEAKLRKLEPDFGRLAKLNTRGVVVTCLSKSKKYDFVSRFFAPSVGIDEDPVTGSAHCCLGPYWGEKLGKREMVGYQASARGGVVGVRLRGERVVLGGRAVTVVAGRVL